jgi:hypothetical protein
MIAAAEQEDLTGRGNGGDAGESGVPTRCPAF